MKYFICDCCIITFCYTKQNYNPLRAYHEIQFQKESNLVQIQHSPRKAAFIDKYTAQQLISSTTANFVMKTIENDMVSILDFIPLYYKCYVCTFNLLRLQFTSLQKKKTIK